AELAKRAGVCDSTISHAMNGHRIRPGKVKALVDALLKVEPIPGIESFLALDEEEQATEEVA
ncbi:MAG: hypothetical protein ACREP9_13315, partial [Candidatus Dormibacteraceae bacterium]